MTDTPLPYQSSDRYMIRAGTGADLIFNRGVDLPGFASFPLLEKPTNRAVLARQITELVETARASKRPCIIETPTWSASRDRAAVAGCRPQSLGPVNRNAADMLAENVAQTGSEGVLRSACIGPSTDPYADTAPMSMAAAQDSHAVQIGFFKGTGIELVTAYTLNKVPEVAGLALAAKAAGFPVVIALEVETDGCLSDGTSIDEAIAEIDRLIGAVPAYYMVNCAHPTHIVPGLTGNPRLKGFVVNASNCSHSELEEVGELDAGDPDALAREMANIISANPEITVFCGCCGTDMRRLAMMSEAIRQ